jgi:hypothetical protein
MFDPLLLTGSGITVRAISVPSRADPDAMNLAALQIFANTWHRLCLNHGEVTGC